VPGSAVETLEISLAKVVFEAAPIITRNLPKAFAPETSLLDERIMTVSYL
jgi:hypothetical protein